MKKLVVYVNKADMVEDPEILELVRILRWYSGAGCMKGIVNVISNDLQGDSSDYITNCRATINSCFIIFYCIFSSTFSELSSIINIISS